MTKPSKPRSKEKSELDGITHQQPQYLDLQRCVEQQQGRRPVIGDDIGVKSNAWLNKLTMRVRLNAPESIARLMPRKVNSVSITSRHSLGRRWLG
jgi:hypothetical protein